MDKRAFFAFDDIGKRRSGLLSKLFLTKQQRRSVLKWTLYAMVLVVLSVLQDVLLCIQTGKTVDDPGRMKFETEEFYLKSEEELRELFPNCDEAFENTVQIADRCNLEFTFHEYHLPSFPVPEGYTNEEYFRKLFRKTYGMPHIEL